MHERPYSVGLNSVEEDGETVRATYRQIISEADVKSILDDSTRRPVLVFKHSTTCPVSARAHRAWAEFLDSPQAGLVDHAFVRVIEERPASLGLAERVGVGHQSPQALLIRDGRALWHDSHRGITVEALAQAVERSAHR